MTIEDQFWSIGLAMAAVVWLGLWIDTLPLRKYLPGPMVVIVSAAILSNTGIIPLESGIYDAVTTYLVPLAIPLLLFKANLRTLFRETGGVLTVFLLAAVATVGGAVVAYFLIDLGDETAKIAGAFAGAWIGGIANMAAVSEAVEMTRPTFAVVVSVAAPLSMLGLLILLTLPTLPGLRQLFASDDQTPAGAARTASETDASQSSPLPTFSPTHMFGAVVVSLAICAVSELLAHSFGIDRFAILIITLLTVLCVNMRPSFFAELRGSFELGMLFMYVFFAAIGASTDISVFLKNASTIALFGGVILASHIALMLLAARVLKLKFEEILIASCAAILGPAATAAMASSRGWQHLVTPGVLCGVFGYVIANFTGVFVASVLP